MNEAMKEINDEIKKVKEETNSDFEIEVTETTDESLEDQKFENDFPKIHENRIFGKKSIFHKVFYTVLYDQI